jgi:Tfp pilus assembly protein PilF
MAVQSAIGAAKGAVEELDVAAATSVLTTVYLQANMPAEALRTLDEALEANPDDEDLKAQKVALEKRLGLVE